MKFATLLALAASANALKDIVDTAAAIDDFSTLVAAVGAAGLAEALKGDGPFTVIAPRPFDVRTWKAPSQRGEVRASR